MNLSTSVVSDSRDTHLKVHEQQERYNSSTPVCSHSDSVMELLPTRPLCVPALPGCIHNENRSHTTPVCLPEELDAEDASLRNTLPACNYQHHNGVSLNSPQWSSGLSDLENKQEGDYDVLPLRNKTCQINPSTEMDEGVYDIPLSYRRTSDHQDPTESIYDVPSSLLRHNSDHTIVAEEHLEEVYWCI
ncbi:hypothetical protein PAMP_009297 [Pampus punctatissimus]